MFDAVSCVIPGASRKEQILSNLEVEKLPELTSEEMQTIKQVYETHIKPLVPNCGNYRAITNSCNESSVVRSSFFRKR